MTFVAKSPVHGWGVFASSDLHPGQIIEECVVFEISNEFPDILKDHRLAWTDTHDVMASGNANLYNHSDDPSVVFESNFEFTKILIRAVKPVQAGEELFKKYACPIWW